MNPVDERILEYLRDESAGTPKAIAERLDRHNNYIGARCREMASRGLVDRVGRGVYIISDTGKSWLDEELDADELTDSKTNSH